MAWFFDAAFWAGLLVGVLFFVAFVGSILPLLPGGVLAWAAVVIHKLWLGEASVPWWFVGLATVLIGIAQVADYLLTAWGAKRFGSTWRGALGAVIGGIAGLFIPPPLLWVILGPVVGAVVFELIGGQTWKASGKAGFGTVVGGVVAMFAKLALTVATIIGFYWAL